MMCENCGKVIGWWNHEPKEPGYCTLTTLRAEAGPSPAFIIKKHTPPHGPVIERATRLTVRRG